MSIHTPRIRIFAGPNGSGKSTMKEVLDPKLLGVYINADEIEKNIKSYGFITFDHFQIQITDSENLFVFLRNSELLRNSNLLSDIDLLTFTNNCLFFNTIKVNSYHAAVVADFIRHQLLDKRFDFSFETVMSGSDKITFLAYAKNKGYRVYLYFVATDDPEINIARVSKRVRQGGHDVPQHKIKERYIKSLANLSPAIAFTNRAYIFDNSGSGKDERVLLAEITDAKILEYKHTEVPFWFDEYVHLPGDLVTKQ